MKVFLILPIVASFLIQACGGSSSGGDGSSTVVSNQCSSGISTGFNPECAQSGSIGLVANATGTFNFLVTKNGEPLAYEVLVVTSDGSIFFQNEPTILGATPKTDTNGMATLNYKVASNLSVGTIKIQGTLLTGHDVTLTVGPKPSKLTFSTQPGFSITGIPLSPQPVVQILGSNGGIAPSGTYAISLSAYKDSNCSTLATGNLTANSVSSSSGAASFSGVSYDKAEGIFLKASATGLASVCSAYVQVNGPPAKLSYYMALPSAARNSIVWTSQPGVLVNDSNGNNIPSATNSVTLAVYSDSLCNNPVVGALSSSRNPLAAVTGLAQFAGVSINQTGNFYLGASSPGLTPVCSSTITISP